MNLIEYINPKICTINLYHACSGATTPFGVVLTCEPGLYIREENIGIRIENDILITKGDPIDLMKDIPIEIDEIEGLMSKK